MRIDLEEKFIKDFINDFYQERLLYEFKSPKKRINAILRFSHNTDELIKKEYIFLKLKRFDEKEIVSFLQGEDSYVISFDYVDGISMNINEILNYLYDEYSPVIVCGTNFAIVKKEFEKGSDNFYLLKK